MQNAQFLRRKAAGEYLKAKFGFGSEKTLAKLATLGGGPLYHQANRLVLYTAQDLDSWALARISPPRSSTSDPTGRTAPLECEGA
jgi:hypothetical protein